jgi:hypothetical protein
MSLFLVRLVSPLYEREGEPFPDPAAVGNGLISSALWALIVFVVIWVAKKRSARVRYWLFSAKVMWLKSWHWLWVTRDSENRPLKPFVAPTREPRGEEAEKAVVGESVPVAQPAQIAGPSPSPVVPKTAWTTSIPSYVPRSAADLKGTLNAPPRFRVIYVTKGDRIRNERGYLLRLENHGDGDAQDVRLDPHTAVPTGSSYWQLIPAHGYVEFRLEPHADQYRFPTRFDLSFTESSGRRRPAIELVLPPEDAPEA